MRLDLRWLLPLLLIFLANPPVFGQGAPPVVRVGILLHAPQVPFAVSQGGALCAISSSGQPVALAAGRDVDGDAEVRTG